MRQYCLCLFIGLLAVAFLQSGAMGNNANILYECCITYYGRKIPVPKIDSYMETRVDCTKPAVIFLTKKGYRLCADPKLGWVRNAMKAVDDRDL